MATRDHHLLFTLDDYGTFFSSSLHSPVINKEFGFLVLFDIKAIEPFLQYIKRSIRSMDLKFFFFLKAIDPQINVSRKHMDPDLVISFSGKLYEINLSVAVDTKIILFTKMNLCPALPGSKLVSLYNR
jgi:ABC-type uncharacterized transport system permease subunit